MTFYFASLVHTRGLKSYKTKIHLGRCHKNFNNIWFRFVIRFLARKNAVHMSIFHIYIGQIILHVTNLICSVKLVIMFVKNEDTENDKLVR